MSKKEPDFPKWTPQKLKEGKQYKFTPLNKAGNMRKQKATTKVGGMTEAPFKATVEKAYKNWYLLDTATGYHTTIMRNAVGVDWEVKRV